MKLSPAKKLARLKRQAAYRRKIDLAAGNASNIPTLPRVNNDYAAQIQTLKAVIKKWKPPGVYKPSKTESLALQKLKKEAYRIEKKIGGVIPRPHMPAKYKSKTEYERAYSKLSEYITGKASIQIGKPGKEFSISVKDVLEDKKKIARYEKRRKNFYGKVLDKEAVYGGKGLGVPVRAQAAMLYNKGKGTIFETLLNPQSIEYKTFASEAQYKGVIERIEKQSQKEYWEEKTQRFKDNFLIALRKIVPTTEIYTQLEAIIEAMNLKQFMEMYYRSWETLAAIFANSPEEIEALGGIFNIVNNAIQTIAYFEKEYKLEGNDDEKIYGGL